MIGFWFKKLEMLALETAKVVFWREYIVLNFLKLLYGYTVRCHII